MSTSVNPVADRLNAPGIAMIVVGVLAALTSLVAILFNVASMMGMGLAGATDTDFGTGPMNQYVSMMGGGLGIVLEIVRIGLSVLVALAGLKMRAAEAYGLAMAGAIVAIIPCCLTPCPCCLFATPVGIWALVVLLNEEVKASFR